MQSFLTAVEPQVPKNPDTLHIYPDKSIGIAEIRTVQSFLSKKPMQSPQNTVVIHDAHLLTYDAQQAFLKTLEEPPEHALIYLVTPYADQLIPTILSRVQILPSSHTSYLSNTTNLTYSLELFQKLLSAGVGDRLLVLDKEEFTRETGLMFLNDLEQILHQSLNSSTLRPPLEFKRGSEGAFFSLIQETKKYLKSNVSIRLAMDNFVISLPTP